MKINGITEMRTSQGLSYLLEEKDMFFPTGYKIMQTQEKNRFLPCVRILHNGKDKLIYLTEPYKPLSGCLDALKPESFLTILEQVVKAVLSIRSNGFLQEENIQLAADHLYLDPKNLHVHFLYLPVKARQNGEADLHAEAILKANLTEIFRSYPKLMGSNARGLMEMIEDYAVCLEDIQSFLEKRPPEEELVKSTVGEADAVSPVRVQPPMLLTNEQPAMPQAEAQDLVPAVEPVISHEIAGGSAEMLPGTFQPTVMLQGLNTPQQVEILITKDDFKIGKSQTSVDGVINFNKAISRIHCRILCRNGQYAIADLGSSNGTYLNGGRLEPQQEVPLKLGDKVKLANTTLIVKKA